MNKNICIVGYGRLGQTLAGILRDHFEVVVLEIDLERAAIAATDGFTTTTLEQLSDYDTIFICVPINVFEQTITSIRPYVAAGSTVIDTCSVKVIPAQIMARELPESIQIIATHPLFGPDSVGRGLETLTMVTHPVRTDHATFAEWDTFWRSLGLNVINATPDEHDKVTAYTLGMTHFFGRIMDELQLEPHAITTVGYRALYEVMQQTNNDSWQLFYDMQAFNPHAKAMREKVYAAIEAVETKLDNEMLKNNPATPRRTNGSVR